MARVRAGLSKIADRMEILARGLDSLRKEAEVALERGRPLEAREHARAMLIEHPGSAIALALWAEAAESAWLDEEACEALSLLCQVLPGQSEAWLRLGQCRARAGIDGAREALERALAAATEPATRRPVLLELCDLDLALGDHERAARWLERGEEGFAAPDPAFALRRLECAIQSGQLGSSEALLAALGDDLGDEGHAPDVELARVELARAEVYLDKLTREDDPQVARLAEQAAVRAYVLDARGAQKVLARLISQTRDVACVARMRRVLGSDVSREPQLVAAFAFAEGRRADARAALAQAVQSGDRGAQLALIDLVIEGRDAEGVEALPEASLPPGLRAVKDALAALQAGDLKLVFDRLFAISDASLSGWVDELASSALQRLLDRPASEQALWLEILGREARELEQSAIWLRIAELGHAANQPIVLSVVGEFNAGKSTFINALLGADVAPTGVLPTTATLHRLAWAPDAFARILVRGAPDRTVVHSALKSTLSELVAAQAEVVRVQIYAPLERLRWVEILDTPGFNAPDPEHAKRARQSFDEVDAVLWLLDATGPMKGTEAEVLRSVGAQGLPILVLLNKRDRVKPADQPRVLEHVMAGLAESGIRTREPPLFFSARQALQASASAEQGADLSASPVSELDDGAMSQVVELLSRSVVDRADELRRHSLLRRSQAIVTELLLVAETRAQGLEDAARVEQSRRDALRGAAERIGRDPEQAARWLDEATEHARGLLAADLRPLLDRGHALDVTTRSYVAQRFVARLTEPSLQGLTAGLGLTLPDALPEAWPKAQTRAMLESALEVAARAAEQPFELLSAGRGRLWSVVSSGVVRALRNEAAQPSLDSAERRGLRRLRLLQAALAHAEPNLGALPQSQRAPVADNTQA